MEKKKLSHVEFRKQELQLTQQLLNNSLYKEK